MLKDYKHLAYRDGKKNFCCSCGMSWVVTGNNPPLEDCPSCGTKLKYEDKPIPPAGEWICTDSDFAQYRRKATEKGAGVFELYQVNHYLEDEYRIAHGFIYPKDYDIEQNEELLTAYNWPQETIDSPEFPGIIAEAVFESGEFQYDGEKEYTSFEEAAKVIGATIGVDVFSYILSKGGR